MNQDQEVFSDPEVFRPERFLEKDNPLMAKVLDDTHGIGHWSFGGGRRCAISLNIEYSFHLLSDLLTDPWLAFSEVALA